VKLINFTIIKLTISLIVGIIVSYLYPISANLATIFVLSSISITLAIKLLTKKTANNYLFGIFAYISFACIGAFTVSTHNHKQFQNHYSQHLKDENPEPLITFRISEVLKPNKYYDKYHINILQINSKNVIGKSLLHVKKDSIPFRLKVDDILATIQPLQIIKEPLNPEQFNYKDYLDKQYIYHQITTTSNSLFRYNKREQTLFGHAALFRNLIIEKLEQFDFKTNELAIINALILGQRQDINQEIYNDYTQAGAIHILAVSGLHIGIILLLLNALLSPLNHYKKGRLIKMLLILILLWSFAVIAGLSASVTRAVTMFSIISIGTSLKRPTNIYNTLSISIFVLLLFKPLFIFDVGFQLSYIAVIAIVSIQPILEQVWQPKWFIVKQAWQILTVSLAAQLGVLPLSLFYFHQFPSLFFISNLVIIPCLGFILGFGILMIILVLLNCLPEYAANFYGSSINCLNTFIKWVSSQKDFIVEDISFSNIQVVVSYVLIITAVRWVRLKNYNRTVALLISILLFQSAFIVNTNSSGNEFIIFHNSRKTLITSKIKRKITLHSDSINIKQNSAIRNYKIAYNIDSVVFAKPIPVYKINNKYLLTIDKSGAYNVTRFCPDYILLTNTPKINLNRLIDSIRPLLIIADGSNYKSEILKWKKTCATKKIPFHDTGEKGAFIFKSD